MQECKCGKFADKLESFDDVKRRCAELPKNEIIPFLNKVLEDKDRWITIYQCKVCGKHWVQEYPFSEEHGGGSPCFYIIDIEEPIKYLKESKGLTYRLRQEHEDTMFFNSLGPEIGPKICTYEGCSRKQLVLSQMCKIHHFEMVKKRKAPEK